MALRTGRATRRRVLLGLVVGSHPGPTLVVTAVIAALARSAGRSWSGTAWVAAAVLAGQLAIGWCNDARDASRDRVAGRAEKPTVRGWVGARSLGIAAVLAGLACVPLSLVAAGPVGGAAHLCAVGSALAYDLWLKTTLASILPWVVSFGTVPAFVTYGLEPAAAPALWAVTVGALLGAGAHLANSARDIAGDRAAHATGLAAALGAGTSRLLAVLCLLAATGLLLAQLPLGWPVRVVAFAVLGAGALAAARWQAGHRLFEAILLLAVLDVALLVAAGARVVA